MFEVRAFDEVVSTNEVVRRALEEGTAEGLVCRARKQTGGYGRQGRLWSSPRGGLYQSVLLRPNVKPAQLPSVGLVAALAVREALVSFAGACDADALVKWPNDIVCSVGKICGISTEAHAGGVCLGIGVNVFRPEREEPVGGKYRPAYCAELAAASVGPDGREAYVDALGDALLACFAKRYDVWCEAGFAVFADEYRSFNYLMGRHVELADLTGSVLAQGIVRDVDDDGLLVVERSDGALQHASSGEAHITA